VRLTFASSPDKFTTVTKLRITGLLLCVLYIAVACCFGLVHDHQSHRHCDACAWAVNAVTDVAVPAVAPVVVNVVAFTPVTPSFVVIVAPVLCNTASRAPPLAST
jgi:hypothetical protein